MDAHERRAPVGQAEQALEADGQVDVAAGVEQALPEGVDARQLALAQGQPRLRVGPDDDVGLAAGASPCARAPRGSCSGPPTCGPRRPGGRGRWRRSPPGRRDSARAAWRRPRRGPRGAGRGAARRAWQGTLYTGPAAPALAIRPVRTLRRLGGDGPRDPPARHAHGAQAAARAARPRPRGHLLVRADGLQPHPHRQRAALRRPLAVQALPRARGLRDDARRQRHRHQRQDLRRRAAARRAERRPGAGDDRALLRRHRGPGPRAARSRAAGLGDDRADQGPHPGPARQRLGLRGRRRRLLPRARGPRLRLAEPPLGRRHGPGGGGRRLRSQGGPARLRAVEGPEGGRGHRLGRAVGPRAAGLAHRVLGDGRAGARGRLRGPHRRQRPDLPPPRERGRADAAGPAGPSSRASGCTTGCSRWAARRWPRAWATSPRWPTPWPSTGATR